jgi:hypothetical protein
MIFRAKLWMAGVGLALTLQPQVRALQAQDAKQIVQEAVNAELKAGREDHSHWRYIKTEKGNKKSVVVETEFGAIGKRIQENGRPVTPEEARADDEAVQKFIHEPSLQAKQRRDGAHDDKDSEELSKLLAEAFIWKIESETATTVSLSFRPDPNFHPPDMEARVMGEMAGTLVVDKAQHRIKTMKGTLSEEVNIGYGILGRLHKGGTFDVERRELAPGLWQIYETHVHIEGKALFFKNIGQEQDEVKSEYSPVPAGTTLEQAVGLLNAPAK